MTTFVKRLAPVVALLVVAALVALGPASAAGKLSLWRLKTYIPPADKILDASAQECAKKVGVELAIPDAVGPARLANLGRLTDVSDVVSTITKDLGPVLANAEGAVKFGSKFFAVPHYAIPLVLFYRKDTLAKIGAEPPDTWEEIQQVSDKVTRPSRRAGSRCGSGTARSPRRPARSCRWPSARSAPTR